MPTVVQLIAGPAQCGKTQHLLEHYRSQLQRQSQGMLGQNLWLAPNQVALAQTQDRLLEGVAQAFLAPNLYTFAAYADTLIDHSPRHIRPVSRLQKRRLLQHVIGSSLAAGELQHFAHVALTPGFATQVDEFIADLKRADVWPDQFQHWAVQRTAGGQQYQELAQLYNAYQQALHCGELYDAEGRFWAAREILKQQPPGDSRKYELVVVNGFNDFTTAQYDILGLLGQHSQKLMIALTVEQQSAAQDGSRALLFAKTQETLARLKDQLPTLEVVHKAAEIPTGSSLQQFQSQLFREPTTQDQESPVAFSGVEMLAASSVTGEIEAIAQRIKTLLVTQQAKPQEIVVVSRADELTNRIYQEVFNDYGIPLLCETRPRLEAEPLTRALLTLLRLHQEDWPFQALLETIGNRLFRCLDTATGSATARALESRVAIEHALRSAQLPSGRQALLQQLEYRQNLMAQQPDAHGSQVAYAQQAFQQLDQVLASLPAQASLDQWTQTLQKVLVQLGVFATQPIENSRETFAWNLLRRGLHALAQVDSWSSEADELITLPKLVELISLVAREQRLPAAQDHAGRVRILSAESARKLTITHLFLAGLSEQSFSSAATTSEATTSESQSPLDSLPESLVEPISQSVRHSDAMLLFYELVTRPTASLTLSYPALDAKGQPLSPSPLLTELVRCAGPGRIQQHKMPLGGGAPSENLPLSFGTLRRHAMEQAIEGKQRWLAGMCNSPTFAGAGRAILAGVDSVAQRSNREIFGPHEGLLLSPAAQAALAKRFNVEHLWSPSQLEGYAACPFRFFAEQLLHLEPLAELTLRNDPRRRGNLLHQVLANIHQQLSAAAGSVDPTDTELVEHFLVALNAAVEATPLRGLEQSLREIERREIEAWAPEYAQQETDYRNHWSHLDQPPRPQHFELRFGPDTRSGAGTPSDEASTQVPFELDLGEERICLTGQIDRIDIGRVGDITVFNVIDYKSGQAVKLNLDKVRTGHQLQLPLYALAAEQMLLTDQEAVGLATGYWNIRGKGFETKRGGSLHLRELAGQEIQTSADWQQLQPNILSRVQELISGIRSGEFPVYNEDEGCTRGCTLNTVCRVAQVRSLEKVWPPPEGVEEGEHVD